MKNSVTQVLHTFTDGIILKINKHVFKVSRDILLIAVYIPPINSPVYENSDVKGIGIIENVLCTMNVEEYCILLAGDLNARVGVESDCIESIPNLPMFNEYEFIFTVDPRVCDRKSLDSHVNNCGRNVLNLCKMYALFILNG